MNDIQKRQLEKLIESVTHLDRSLLDTKPAQHHIESRRAEGNVTEIYANAEGLIHIAAKVLSLAQSEFVGKHYHFDEAGMVDSCEQPFVIGYIERPETID